MPLPSYLWLHWDARPTDAERAHWRRNMDLIDGVTTSEDFAACAKIQANLRAGAVPFLILGRNEPGVAHFHRTLHDAVPGQALRTLARPLVEPDATLLTLKNGFVLRHR